MLEKGYIMETEIKGKSLKGACWFLLCLGLNAFWLQKLQSTEFRARNTIGDREEHCRITKGTNLPGIHNNPKHLRI